MFVRNLPPLYTALDLHGLFGTCGRIVEQRLLVDSRCAHPRAARPPRVVAFDDRPREFDDRVRRTADGKWRVQEEANEPK